MDKPIVRHLRARRDIEDALYYYNTMASEEVALRFVEALEDAAAQISQFPGAGSPRFWEQHGLSGLRSRRIPGFPHLIFYVEEPDRVVFWRVLHPARDLSAQLAALLQEESK